MNRYEYKLIQEVLTRFEHKKLTNEGYDLVHDIKSEIGMLYATKLRFEHYEILGFSIEDLCKIAYMLKDKHITDRQLKNTLDAFDCGFQYANRIQQKAWNTFISKMFEGGKNEKE